MSDSSLKLIPEFSGDCASNEQDLTHFLRQIYAQVKTSDLSERTTLNVILRKLTGSAFILADKHVQDTSMDTMSAGQMVKLLENKFLASCSPLAAESQLHTLRQGGLTYAQLQAKCTRLATLATRMEKADNRPEIRNIKEASGFIMALSNADRITIHNENTRRHTHNLRHLSLDQMADHLQALAAEKISFHKDAVMMAQEAPVANQPVEYHPIQTFNYNHRGMDRTPRGQNMNRQVAPPNYAPAHNKFGPMANNTFRGRGNFQHAGNRGQNKGANRAQRPFVTADMVHVDKNGCLLCGDSQHSFKQQMCPYFDSPLMSSPCKHCCKGGHKHTLCKQQKKYGPSF